MKNVIKKISAIAMAFTLLGTGTAVTNFVSPKSKALTANAASPRSCPICHGNQTGVCEAGYWWGLGCSVTNSNGQKYYYLLCGTCGAHTGFWA